MFTSGLKESSQKEVELHDIDAKAFGLVLHYIYTGSVAYRQENVSPFFYS